MTKLFVYGTLKQGFSRHSVLDGAAFLGEYDLDHATMYDLGAFPMVMASFNSDDMVRGELYEVDDEHLAVCDAIETGYDRQWVKVTSVAGHMRPICEAQMYVLNMQLTEVPKLRGDLRIWNKKG